MITKEKLEELIKQEATIYLYDYYCRNIIFCELNNEKEIYNFNGKTFYYGEISFSLECIFETKERAEHFSKFGNVTKTIKMPVPPTWEEFIESEPIFEIGYLNLILYNQKLILFKSEPFFPQFEYLRLPNTKENYYKALNKMVELWREE